MKFGLKEKELGTIIECLKKYEDVERSCVFGSRAKGNYKASSDIDIALFGEKIDFNVVSDIHYYLNEEADLVYFVDVLHFETLESRDLQEHIIRCGVEIYDNTHKLNL